MQIFQSGCDAQYDPAFRAAEQGNGRMWKTVYKKTLLSGETQITVFGPELAASVLDDEIVAVHLGSSPESSARWAGVHGLSAEWLRESFPRAVADAQQYRKTEAELLAYVEQRKREIAAEQAQQTGIPRR